MLGTQGLHPWAGEEPALLPSPHLPARPPAQGCSWGRTLTWLGGCAAGADADTASPQPLQSSPLHAPRGGLSGVSLTAEGSTGSGVSCCLHTAHLLPEPWESMFSFMMFTHLTGQGRDARPFQSLLIPSAGLSLGQGSVSESPGPQTPPEVSVGSPSAAHPQQGPRVLGVGHRLHSRGG